MSDIVFSETGEVHGYGTDRYKWVSRLTAEEREAVREGTATVIVEADGKSGGSHGSYYREVTYDARNRRYNRRVTNIPDEVIDEIRRS